MSPTGRFRSGRLSNRFEARPSLALTPRDRVWVAYEEGDENWGKDYANDTPAKVPVKQPAVSRSTSAERSG